MNSNIMLSQIANQWQKRERTLGIHTLWCILFDAFVREYSQYWNEFEIGMLGLPGLSLSRRSGE